VEKLKKTIIMQIRKNQKTYLHVKDSTIYLNTQK